MSITVDPFDTGTAQIVGSQKGSLTMVMGVQVRGAMRSPRERRVQLLSQTNGCIFPLCVALEFYGNGASSPVRLGGRARHAASLRPATHRPCWRVTLMRTASRPHPLLSPNRPHCWTARCRRRPLLVRSAGGRTTNSTCFVAPLLSSSFSAHGPPTARSAAPSHRSAAPAPHRCRRPPQAETAFVVGVNLSVSTTADISTGRDPYVSVGASAHQSVSDYCARVMVDINVGIMPRLIFGIWVRPPPATPRAVDLLRVVARFSNFFSGASPWPHVRALFLCCSAAQGGINTQIMKASAGLTAEAHYVRAALHLPPPSASSAEREQRFENLERNSYPGGWEPWRLGPPSSSLLTTDSGICRRFRMFMWPLPISSRSSMPPSTLRPSGSSISTAPARRRGSTTCDSSSSSAFETSRCVVTMCSVESAGGSVACCRRGGGSAARGSVLAPRWRLGKGGNSSPPEFRFRPGCCTEICVLAGRRRRRLVLRDPVRK